MVIVYALLNQALDKIYMFYCRCYTIDFNLSLRKQVQSKLNLITHPNPSTASLNMYILYFFPTF